MDRKERALGPRAGGYAAKTAPGGARAKKKD